MASLKEIRERFGVLGYTVVTRSRDDMGRTWPYRTLPLGAGSHGQFRTKGELERYLEQVERNRE